MASSKKAARKKSPSRPAAKAARPAAKPKRAKKPAAAAKVAKATPKPPAADLVYSDVRREMRSRLLGRLLGA